MDRQQFICEYLVRNVKDSIGPDPLLKLISNIATIHDCVQLFSSGYPDDCIKNLIDAVDAIEEYIDTVECGYQTNKNGYLLIKNLQESVQELISRSQSKN